MDEDTAIRQYVAGLRRGDEVRVMYGRSSGAVTMTAKRVVRRTRLVNVGRRQEKRVELDDGTYGVDGVRWRMGDYRIVTPEIAAEIERRGNACSLISRWLGLAAGLPHPGRTRPLADLEAVAALIRERQAGRG